MLAYLLAAGLSLLGGGRVGGGAWLALHLVLLGTVTNAIIVWSDQFAAALLHARPSGETAALARLVGLNLAVVAVLAGVQLARPALTATGAGLLTVVVVAHALILAARLRRGLAARFGDAVWFYLAASAALLAGIGLGLLLSGGAAGSADAYRAMRLAHGHLNVLGWIGLTVLGTLFTLWPTVLRTRMVAGVPAAARRSFPLAAGGLLVATAGLLTQQRTATVVGLAGYAAGVGVALGPFVGTLRQRRPFGAAAWMLAAGTAWFAAAVIADLTALLGSRRLVDLDSRVARLVPAVAVGFGLQMVAGALTYLLPTVWGRGAHGNRRLTAVLEVGWPVRVVAWNLGVLLLTIGPGQGWTIAGRWLAGFGLGSFVLLATAALAWRVVEDSSPGDRTS
jgi:nitrite reductase (NO-forming)